MFIAAATDIGFDLRVRDTATGRTRQYTREAGKPVRALVDVSAVPGGGAGNRMAILPVSVNQLDRVVGVFRGRFDAPPDLTHSED